MSQRDDSEHDIWEYKPLQKKKKKTRESAPVVAKRRCTTRKTSKRVKGAESGDCSTVVNVEAGDRVQKDKAAEEPSSGDFCPVCQMPFSILVVQTQRWHVAECLDTLRDKCQGTDTNITHLLTRLQVHGCMSFSLFVTNPNLEPTFPIMQRIRWRWKGKIYYSTPYI